MRNNPFEEMEAEMKGLRTSMRPPSSPLRWGRVLTGVVIEACATFAFAYYLPLERAHELLTRRFSDLQAQVDSGTHALEQARGEAKALTEQKQALESQLSQAELQEKTRTDASRSLKGALEAKLQKPLAQNHAAVGFVGGRATAALALGFLLSPAKLSVSPQGKLALCSVASLSAKRVVRVLAVADKKSIAASSKLKTPLEYSSAVAALVAQTLLEQCNVAPTQLSATGFPVEPPANAKLEGKKLSGPRVELWLDDEAK